jgi:tRNA G18 (ribose-2'-O)-methylase SpoU
VALGAEITVPWEKEKSAVRLINKLRAENSQLKIVALENNVKYKTISLSKYNPKFPLVLIVGEETKGLPKKILDLVDDIVEIPMNGHKESLNVSVAAGIATYALLNL